MRYCRNDFLDAWSSEIYWHAPLYQTEDEYRSQVWIYGNEKQNLMERFTRRVCRVIFKTIFDKLKSKNYNRDEIDRLFELDTYYTNRLKDFAARNV